MLGTTIAAFRRILLSAFLMVFYFHTTIQEAKSQENFRHTAPKFQNLTLSDGLSNLAIHAICQDDLGYIWIGTARGLNKFDGISFQHYYYNDDNVPLHSNEIKELHKAPNGDLFCITNLGTSIYTIAEDRLLKEKSFSGRYHMFVNHDSIVYAANQNRGLYRYWPNRNKMLSIETIPANSRLSSLVSDKETGIWGKARNNKYLLNYNPKTDRYEKYTLPNSDTLTIGGSLSIINRQLFITTNSTISIFNIETRAFVDLEHHYPTLQKLEQKTISFIEQVEPNTLWIGTKTDGLFIYNTLKDELSNFQKSDDNQTLNANHLTCFYKDNSNNVWLGTFDRGIEVAFEKRKNFNFDLALHHLTKGLFITSITSDDQHNYYIGTRLNGVLIYNSETKKSKTYNRTNSFLEHNLIRSLQLSSKNELWISAEKQTYILNLKSGRARKIDIPRPNNGLVTFCEKDQIMFAGSDKQGILVYSIQGELLDTVKWMGGNITQILSQKNKEALIVASYGSGVYEFDYAKKKSSAITLANTNLKLDECITCYFDSKNNLWLGNFKYGLYSISPENTSQVYTRKNGLPSNDITGIMEDNFGNIWISTAYGLSVLNTEKQFSNYSYNEGLENIQFHQKATLKDKDGTLYFGGNFGLTFFNPKSLGLEANNAPRILLETLKVSNREVRPHDKTGILSQSLALTKHIILDHHYPNFSIEFKGLDYVAAKNVKYAYKLDGYDQHWNYVNHRTYASYQNLRRGSYTFMVKAQNNSGAWSKTPAALHIRVKPAPWFTVWAFLLYFIILLFVTVAIFRIILNGKLYKKELEIEHNERVRENEIAQMKMRFFTNISHEIRTPVTLIKGNVDYLLSELKERKIELKSTGSLINSTDRLLKLIGQLLAFRQLENDALDLQIKKEDIIQLSKKVVDSFVYNCKLKGVTIELETKDTQLWAPIDSDKYEKVLNNLIGNALKFSKRNGFIRVIVDEKESAKLDANLKLNASHKNYIHITVIDNGEGISEKLLPHIFDRFAHEDNENAKPDYSGSGIGLNFTKRLIDLHGGAIYAESEKNSRTCFSFVLPSDESSYEENTVSTQAPSVQNNIPAEVYTIDEQESEHKKVILIAEDDAELNKFMVKVLSKQYKVITTFDGEEALNVAKRELPDLIISDIMMPKKDGIRLCESIRQDDMISHTPIILLTAKADVQSKITGYEFGADEYITKPFELEVLKTRVQNILKQRNIIQQHFKKALPFEPKSDTVNQFEINFMKKVNAVVEEHYKSSEFNVQQLSEHMNMSRTSFYRKFMSIANISPKEYITNYRINKSVELIQEGYESLGEVCFLCGFSSQSIFSLAFKKVKGISPLQFKKSLKAKA